MAEMAANYHISLWETPHYRCLRCQSAPMTKEAVLVHVQDVHGEIPVPTVAMADFEARLAAMEEEATHGTSDL
jgi:hypothetical protein